MGDQADEEALDAWEDESATVRAKATGMIILGGGLVKHHICNANLMRNGAPRPARAKAPGRERAPVDRAGTCPVASPPLPRPGANYAVFVNTGNTYGGK